MSEQVLLSSSSPPCCWDMGVCAGGGQWGGWAVLCYGVLGDVLGDVLGVC